jgi:hypothetical protein
MIESGILEIADSIQAFLTAHEICTAHRRFFSGN